MKLKLASLSLLAAICALGFAAPPVYPGAKLVDELNDALKKSGQDSTAYQTMDPFEKVYDFYKSKGSEVQARRPPRAGEKMANFKFNETGYAVSLIWRQDSKHGTVFYIAKMPGR
jgi:hypothetical protein